MDDSFLDEGHEAVTDLLKNVDSLVLGEVGVVIYELLEVAITYFLNDVVVMTAFHDIEHLHYVLGFD